MATDDTHETLYSLIRRFEGLRLKAYYCPAGTLTLGYGATGKGILPNTEWTKEQAEARMMLDAENFITGTRKLCPTLEGHPLAAIADFSFNLGLTRLAGSTLRRKLLAGDTVGARNELKKWTRGGGRVLPGLVIRRQAESALL